MAFTLQNDQGGVVGANAYIDVDFFTEYHNDRGQKFSCESNREIEQAIIRATDYLDKRFRFTGERLNIRQTTEWPRLDAHDIDDNTIIGIPPEVKEATAEYARIALGQDDLFPTPTRDETGRVVQSRSEGVGPLNEMVTFTAGAAFEMPRYPTADRKMVVRGLTERRGILRRG